jgi:hypothetical protein
MDETDSRRPGVRVIPLQYQARSLPKRTDLAANREDAVKQPPKH